MVVALAVSRVWRVLGSPWMPSASGPQRPWRLLKLTLPSNRLSAAPRITWPRRAPRVQGLLRLRAPRLTPGATALEVPRAARPLTAPKLRRAQKPQRSPEMPSAQAAPSLRQHCPTSMVSAVRSSQMPGASGPRRTPRTPMLPVLPSSRLSHASRAARPLRALRAPRSSRLPRPQRTHGALSQSRLWKALAWRTPRATALTALTPARPSAKPRLRSAQRLQWSPKVPSTQAVPSLLKP
mmetsp:Transcript_27217/g.86468  ORF Transcript_27217/g.86468 Transcript_27217/m.86468 type:complete len:238 (-) Transcript_27217:186-899(-)